MVSTHSRPKAAATNSLLCSFSRLFQHTAARRRLLPASVVRLRYNKFQHTAARRRLLFIWHHIVIGSEVSTHSRPKAAAVDFKLEDVPLSVSTHSRPKAAAVISI